MALNLFDEESVPTKGHLSEVFAELADEELLARLHSGTLTELAAEVILGELDARGVAVEPGPTAPPQDGDVPSRVGAFSRSAFHFFYTRVLRFPINAVQGSEALWVVLVFGGLTVIFVKRMAFLGVFHLFPARPASPQALPFSYGLLAIYALTAIWFCVAAWRTAAQEVQPAWRIVVRICAVVITLNCLWGSIAAARLSHDRLPAAIDGPSIMDTAPSR